jgi:hypothetical protein
LGDCGTGNERNGRRSGEQTMMTHATTPNEMGFRRMQR